MKCKNVHCQSKGFVAVIETDTKRVIGLKCINCQARYLIEDIEIKNKLEFNRKDTWNSVVWKLGFR